MKLVLLSFLFIAIAACNGGGGGSSGGTKTPTYKVSGKATYDYVPITGSGLNYAGTVKRPIRNAVIEAVDSLSGKTLASTSSDDYGNYLLNVPQNATIRIEIAARMKSPSVVIEDNTDDDAEYVASSNPFTINTDNFVIPDLNAPSGWTGTNGAGSYTGARVAAPFAILDSIYSAVKKVHAVRPKIKFPPLKVNWSVNNVAVSGYKEDGNIGTSHFDGKELYILGKANADSDEYDRHVIVHEWGHFFEAHLSRSDSLGGQHGLGDLIDRTVAFGEGWGNALSGIVFDPDTTYLDSMGNRQQAIGVSFNLENSSDPKPGWFSETSVQQILFDLYDTNHDGADAISMGLGPILDVLMTSQKTTPAVTSIHSFIHGLKTANPTSALLINNLVNSKSIIVNDAYGTGETNDGGIPSMLPLYHELTVNGATEAVELIGDDYRWNEAPNIRYYRFKAKAKETTLSWAANDYHFFQILQAGKFIGGFEESSRNSASMQSYSGTIDTSSGKEYIVQVLTDPDYMYIKTQSMDFTLIVQ